jgi:two-component system, cell cycle sensor histidine kinase and response regulator CckA
LFGKGKESDAVDFVKNILFYLSHIMGNSDAREFKKKTKSIDPIGALSSGPINFAFSGWVFFFFFIIF